MTFSKGKKIAIGILAFFFILFLYLSLTYDFRAYVLTFLLLLVSIRMFVPLKFGWIAPCVGMIISAAVFAYNLFNLPNGLEAYFYMFVILLFAVVFVLNLLWLIVEIIVLKKHKK